MTYFFIKKKLNQLFFMLLQMVKTVFLICIKMILFSIIKQ